MEQRGTRNMRKIGNTRTRGEAKTKSMPWPHSTGVKGATHSNTKGAKAPNSGVEQNKMQFVTPSQTSLL